MRRLLVAACFASIPAFAGTSPDPNDWTPDPDTAAKIDALAMKFDLPAEFGPIATYARYYGGTELGGRRVIVGALITPQVRKQDTGTVHLVTGNEIPAFADGGCMFIYLTYDVETEKITQMHCNYELAVPLPPPATKP